MAEDKFLAFKGLKQYDPDSGWASVAPADNIPELNEYYDDSYDQNQSDHTNNTSNFHDHDEGLYIDPHFEKDLNDLSMDLSQHGDFNESAGRNSRSNSNTGHNNHINHNSQSNYANSKDKHQEDVNVSDPLLSELFEQLHQPPQDELTQNWKIIATSVNILSQRMAQRRDLKERLNKLDLELESLRSNILHDLEDIQKAADQQLSMARLRAEVSTLAQARLASRLKQKNN